MNNSDNKRFKAIIFDMDGTIIDTSHIWCQATRQLIVSCGIELSEHQWNGIEVKMRGLATYLGCELIKKEFGLSQTAEELTAFKVAWALEQYKKGVSFIEGFVDFHRTVTQQHLLNTGLATSADDLTLAATDAQLSLGTFFGRYVYNLSSVNNRAKPDPALYLHASEQMGLLPHECIAIEDSTPGIQAAVNAGLHCIAINTARDRNALTDAHEIVDAYSEIDLPRLLKK